MLALIDSDTPVFATAIASEDVSESIAKSRLDLTIRNIVKGSGCTDYKLFVSGGNNFRYDIDPTYKANRTGSDPKWREALRLHLINEWNAYECVGFEADDACGIYQCSDGSTIICGIDKDLLQIPGKHYQWPIVRKGEIVRPGLYHDIDEETGWSNLFTQALTGDRADCIGFYQNPEGLWRKHKYLVSDAKAEKLLADCRTEEEMYLKVYDVYTEDCEDDDCMGKQLQRLETNLDLLYIWRSLGITYSIRREIHE